MVLSWKMIINVAKCLIFFCTASFLLFAMPSSTLLTHSAYSYETSSGECETTRGRDGERAKKASGKKKQRFGYQKAAHNVMGAYSEFIEMLCMFHSTCLICVSNMASARYV